MLREYIGPREVPAPVNWDGSILTLHVCGACGHYFVTRFWADDPARTGRAQAEILRAHLPFCPAFIREVAL